MTRAPSFAGLARTGQRIALSLAIAVGTTEALLRLFRDSVPMLRVLLHSPEEPIAHDRIVAGHEIVCGLRVAIAHGRVRPLAPAQVSAGGDAQQARHSTAMPTASALSQRRARPEPAA